MKLLDTKTQVPDIYCQESRDFQILCNIYSAVTNSIKFNSDSTARVLDSATCRGEMLDLLSTKLGFFTTKNFSAEDLRYALSGFKDIMHNKGTLTSVASAVNIFLKTLGIHNRVRITLTTDDVEFAGRTIKDHTVIISIESPVNDVTLLEEIFKYIIPFGYEYFITFYVQIDPYDEFELHENVTLIYVSDNINSTVGKTTEEVTNVLPVSYYDGNKYSSDVGYFGAKCYWKVNDDWSITATYNPDATYTSNAAYICNSYYQWIILEPGIYWCYGCPEGGGTGKYFINFTTYGIGGTSASTVTDYGSGVGFQVSEPKRLYVACGIFSDYVTSDMAPITFKPVVIKDPGAGYRPTNHIPPSLFTHTTANYVTITYHETGPSDSTKGWSSEVKSDGTIVLKGKNTYAYAESMVLLDPSTFHTYPKTGYYTYTSNLTNLSSSTLYSELNNRPQPGSGTSYTIINEPFTTNVTGGNYMGLSLYIGKQVEFNDDEFKPMLTPGSEGRPFIQPGTTQNVVVLSDTPISDTGNRILGGVNDGEVIGDELLDYGGELNYLSVGTLNSCCRYDEDTHTITVDSPNYANLNDFANNLHPAMDTGLPTEYAGRICNTTPIDVTYLNSVTVTYAVSNFSTKVYLIYAKRDANGLVFRKNSGTSGMIIDVSDATELYISLYTSSTSLPITVADVSDIQVTGNATWATADLYLGVPKSPMTVAEVNKLPLLPYGIYTISHTGNTPIKLCTVTSGGTVTIKATSIQNGSPYTLNLTSDTRITFEVPGGVTTPVAYPNLQIVKGRYVTQYTPPSTPEVSSFNYRGLAKSLNEIYDPVANDLVGLIKGKDCYIWSGTEYEKKLFAGDYASLSIIPEPIEDSVVHITSSHSYYYRASYGWVQLNYRGDAQYIEKAEFTDLQVNDLVITFHIAYYLYTGGAWSWYNHPIKIYESVETVT